MARRTTPPTAAPEGDGTYLGAKLTGKSPTGRPDAPTWRLEPHVCRVCFSRVLSQPSAEGRAYLCSNCGSAAVGHSPSVLCACGLRLRGGKDLGVRCVANDNPSPEAPSLFVARQVVM